MAAQRKKCKRFWHVESDSGSKKMQKMSDWWSFDDQEGNEIGPKVPNWEGPDPERLAEILSSLADPKLRAVVGYLAATGVVSEACKLAGVPTGYWYARIPHDPGAQDAVEWLRQVWADHLEGRLLQMARRGVAKQRIDSDGHIRTLYEEDPRVYQTLLRALRPQLYRDRDPQPVGTTQVVVTFAPPQAAQPALPGPDGVIRAE